MIYLNNAATSWPKPSSVCEAVQACLMDTPASQFRGGSAILKKDTEERCRGLLLYIVLCVFFAYFYTSITFNPLEVADNIKKQGGFIPGIRPGKPTSDYLTKILNYIIFIGAVGLIIVAVIPFFFNGVFGANVSFGGTSIIIIVGVILETVKQIESQLLVRNYKGFLNN